MGAPPKPDPPPTFQSLVAREFYKQIVHEFARRDDIAFVARGVSPPFNGYISPGDFLQVSILTTAPTTGLVLYMRTLTGTGDVSFFQQNLDGVPLSTFTTKIYPASEGFIVSLCISNLNGGLADQVCFVCVGLQRGPNPGLQPHTILVSGYVTNLFTLTWPPVYVRGPATGGAGNYKLIQTQVLAGAAATIVFSSIAQTFADLIVVLNGRSDAAVVQTDVGMQFNGDAGANYDAVHQLTDGTTPLVGRNTAFSNAPISQIPGGTAPASTVSACEAVIHNYSQTTFYKAGVANAGAISALDASNQYVDQTIFQWRSTAAITQVSLSCVSGNFVTNTRCSLYGRN